MTQNSSSTKPWLLVLAWLLLILLTSQYFQFDDTAHAQVSSTGTASLSQVSTPTSGFATLAPVFSPLITVTPNPDGSVVHIVQQGQTLWTIAALYNLTLEEVLAINGFNENTLILPGNVVKVLPPHTPTPTISPTPLPPTLTPTRTATVPRPTRTATPTIAPLPSPTPVEAVNVLENLEPWRATAIIVIALGALVAVIALFFVKE